jgi:Family of unknown function (DUF6196)
MHVSQETPEQTAVRLRRVMVEAEFIAFAQPYAFVETPADAFPGQYVDRALAFVRDEQVWSALVPADDDPQRERFLLFGFHFLPEADNSGFVGWLASHLKTSLGTGVLVVCGQNSKRGGIFDYWGVPWAIGPAALAEIERLRHK